MKLKRLNALILIIILTLSCKNKDQKISTLGMDQVQNYSVDTKRSDPLSVENGAKMISSGLNEPFLEVLAKRFGIGGYFEADSLKITGQNIGIVLWPCYNPEGEDRYPKFFLVAEQVERYDSTDSPSKNNLPGSNLIMPLKTHHYNGTSNDQLEAKKEILRKKDVSASLPYPKIDSVRVLKYVRRFEKLMEGITHAPDFSLCKYGQYFYINNSNYKNFIGAKDIEYVHYYMGFAKDDEHRPNYFRPILVGVKIDGTTIEKNNKARDEDPLLQKSIPPPPDN
jgi:hypothetical protein